MAVAGSPVTCIGVAGVSTVVFGALSALSFGFGAVFFGFGLGADFTTLRATFVAA